MAKRDDIAERLKAAGVDPLQGMVRIAEKAEASGNLALAGKMFAELMEYTAPKLKSMEMSFDPEAPLVVMTAEERRARIAQLAVQTGVVRHLTAVPAERVIPAE